MMAMEMTMMEKSVTTGSVRKRWVERRNILALPPSIQFILSGWFRAGVLTGVTDWSNSSSSSLTAHQHQPSPWIWVTMSDEKEETRTNGIMMGWTSRPGVRNDYEFFKRRLINNCWSRGSFWSPLEARDEIIAMRSIFTTDGIMTDRTTTMTWERICHPARADMKVIWRERRPRGWHSAKAHHKNG